MWKWLTGRDKVKVNRLYGDEDWPGQFERDFETLMTWERDGIFPRLYGGGPGPDWYVDEKHLRAIAIEAKRIVSPKKFGRGAR